MSFAVVLPPFLKQSLMVELNKRLDLDIEEMLESPKLRLKLSPAELDKQLLDLYNFVTDGPGGDILRIIGGGQEVALQNLYIKRKALEKEVQPYLSFGSFDSFDDEGDAEKRTVTQWVNLALRRNLPKPQIAVIDTDEKSVDSQLPQKKADRSKMSMLILQTFPSMTQNWRQGDKQSLSSSASRFCPRRSSGSSFKILI